MIPAHFHGASIRLSCQVEQMRVHKDHRAGVQAPDQIPVDNKVAFPWQRKVRGQILKLNVLSDRKRLVKSTFQPSMTARYQEKAEFRSLPPMPPLSEPQAV